MIDIIISTFLVWYLICLLLLCFDVSKFTDLDENSDIDAILVKRLIWPYHLVGYAGHFIVGLIVGITEKLTGKQWR